MTALRKALAALFLVFATVAFALTPGERIVLFSGIHPVWQANFLGASSLPAGLTWTVPTTLRTLYDSTGKLTYGGNNLALYSGTDPSHLGSAAGSSPPTISQTTYGGQTVEAVAFPTGVTGYGVSRRAGATGSTEGDWSQINGVTYIAAQQIALSRPLTGGEVITVFQTGVQGAWTVTLTASTTNPTTLQQYYASGVANATGGQGTYVYSSGSALGSGVTVYLTAFQVSAVTYQTTPSTYNPTTSTAYYAPRFDYDPSTLAPRGLLVEEARTNIALYSRNMTNAAWVKSSITAALDQTGLDGVANSASSITASGANGTILQTVTLASSQRFYSAYVKRITGSGAVSMTTDNGTTWTAITVTGSWTQVSIPAQTVTNPVFGFKLATNGDAIAVDCNQNEGGAFATSAIITTSASVQRTADVITFSGVPLAAFKSATGSFVAQTQLRANDTSTYQAVLAANDGTNFPVPAYWYTSPKHANAYNGTNFLSAANTLDLTSPQRIATSWSAIGRSVVASGGTVASDGYSAFGGYNITVANLGGNNSGTSNIINGWVQSLAIYNARLPDPTLKTKSVVGAPY